ncbi:hypothetical protein DENSPDRAFT_885564 [Dentipellis sp. KUC8613]|nr:hypothetical protein DENSPDRAFT_885564 [Dentipellis sp. KUC8613]
MGPLKGDFRRKTRLLALSARSTESRTASVLSDEPVPASGPCYETLPTPPRRRAALPPHIRPSANAAAQATARTSSLGRGAHAERTAQREACDALQPAPPSARAIRGAATRAARVGVSVPEAVETRRGTVRRPGSAPERNGRDRGRRTGEGGIQPKFWCKRRIYAAPANSEHSTTAGTGSQAIRVGVGIVEARRGPQMMFEAIEQRDGRQGTTTERRTHSVPTSRSPPRREHATPARHRVASFERTPREKTQATAIRTRIRTRVPRASRWTPSSTARRGGPDPNILPAVSARLASREAHPGRRVAAEKVRGGRGGGKLLYERTGGWSKKERQSLRYAQLRAPTPHKRVSASR